MELIATVAQGSAGPDGDWSDPIPLDTVQHYLDVAHANKMLLILDIQPGQGQFLPQVQYFAKFLSDPSVSIALDPEWKMPAGREAGHADRLVDVDRTSLPYATTWPASSRATTCPTSC